MALGCLPTIAMEVLPPVVREFSAAHPDVIVKVHDSSATEIAERVLSGEAEFGITVATASRWDLDMVAIAKEPFVLVCHRTLPVAKHKTLTWAQLQDVPLVRISAETGNRILIDDEEEDQ
ncbi:MAG: hypothetical protein HC793_04300 [Aquincola sp.]|nr:hypothetical protein [Aquincola sp.]